MQKIAIEYLNEAAELKTEVVSLEADQATNTIATDIYRVENMYGVQYGSTSTHGSSGAAGIITLTNLGNTETYSQISQYATHSESLIHWIRPGYRVVFSEVKIQSINQGSGANVGIFSTFDMSGIGGGTEVWVQCCQIDIAWGNVAVVNIDPHFSIMNPSDYIQAVGFRAKAVDTDNIQASGSFVLYEFIPDYTA